MRYKQLKYYIINLLTYFCVVSITVGCATQKELESSNNKIFSAKNPEIVFLTYTIKKTPTGKKHIDLSSSKTVKGKLKTYKNTKKQITEGDLVCYQIDKNYNIVSEQHIDNPLKKHIEYMDAHLNFKSQLQQLDSAYFSIRLNLNPVTDYITIIDAISKTRLVSSKVKML